MATSTPSAGAGGTTTITDIQSEATSTSISKATQNTINSIKQGGMNLGSQGVPAWALVLIVGVVAYVVVNRGGSNGNA